jgi:hypothetical protein
LKVAVNGAYLTDYPLGNIELEENESIWEVLTGFRVKNGVDMITTIEGVEHIQMSDKDCNGFESYCAL